jgi:two-component system, OmpR family, KDP operon response regulator KdpE
MIEAATMTLTVLRRAVRNNLVSFPSPIPLFVRTGPRKLQLYAVQLYFLCGWSCGEIARRYHRSRFYIWQIVNEWKRHALSAGFLQTIPPLQALVDLRNALLAERPGGGRDRATLTRTTHPLCALERPSGRAYSAGKSSPVSASLRAPQPSLEKLAHDGLGGRGQFRRVSRSSDAAPGALDGLSAQRSPARRGVRDSSELTVPRRALCAKVYDILVVDDEAALRKVIRASLGAGGFAVEEASNWSEAISRIQRQPFDLVLLDSTPGMKGVEACRRIRALAPHMGIVMVTVRDSPEDKVQALQAGADDYVTKPFRFRELIGRMGAVLRRMQAERKPDSTLLQAGDLRLDLEGRQMWKRGELVPLSHKQFDLLALLMKNPGAPLTHIQLLCGVWGPEYGSELEYLRTYVRMLRQKIEDDPARPQYIVTEPWVGYRFQDPSEREQRFDPWRAIAADEEVPAYSTPKASRTLPRTPPPRSA